MVLKPLDFSQTVWWIMRGNYTFQAKILILPSFELVSHGFMGIISFLFTFHSLIFGFKTVTVNNCSPDIWQIVFPALSTESSFPIVASLSDLPPLCNAQFLMFRSAQFNVPDGAKIGFPRATILFSRFFVLHFWHIDICLQFLRPRCCKWPKNSRWTFLGAFWPIQDPKNSTDLENLQKQHFFRRVQYGLELGQEVRHIPK